MTSLTPKRDELLEIASNLFYQQGFGSTGIKQIIDTAGIAKGTFYSHFKSKDEIGLAWLQKRNATWNAWINEAIAQAKSPKAKILLQFELLENWLSENAFRGCAFLNSMAELPDSTNAMRNEIAAHKQGLRESISMLAAEHFAGNPTDFVKHKGLVIFLLFEGALIEAQNFGEVWPISTAHKEVKTILEDKE